MRSIWSLVAIILAIVWLIEPERFPAILEIAASALASTSIYIAIAVAMLAWLKATGAEAVVATAFRGREAAMIVVAAILGGLAPFCSCEVIPFIAGLLAVGAPLSAVMAFWLSSPLIDPPTVIITAGALGWDFAIGKAVAAVALGLFGGIAVALMVRLGAFSNPLRQRSMCSSARCSASIEGRRPLWSFWRSAERRKVFVDAALSNGLFLLKWLAFAYVLEALLITYVPAQAIGAVVGGEGFLPIVTGALVGAPAYLNGYAAPALVSGLAEQGMSVGAAMAFMVAGAVSSVPAMAAVWSLVRPAVFASYLALGIIGAIAAGVLFSAVA